MSPVLGNRRLAGFLLSVAGMLLVHEWAYGIARMANLAESRVSHSHLAAFWSTIGPLVALSLAALALRESRNLHLATPLRARSMVAGMGSMFVTMELVEFARAGLSVGDAFTSPQVIIGLLVVVPIAACMSRLATVAQEVVRTLSLAKLHRVTRPSHTVVVTAVSLTVPVTRRLAFSVCRRGPPAHCR